MVIVGQWLYKYIIMITCSCKYMYSNRIILSLRYPLENQKISWKKIQI